MRKALPPKTFRLLVMRHALSATGRRMLCYVEYQGPGRLVIRTLYLPTP